MPAARAWASVPAWRRRSRASRLNVAVRLLYSGVRSDVDRKRLCVSVASRQFFQLAYGKLASASPRHTSGLDLFIAHNGLDPDWAVPALNTVHQIANAAIATPARACRHGRFCIPRGRWRCDDAAALQPRRGRDDAAARAPRRRRPAGARAPTTHAHLEPLRLPPQLARL